MIYNVSEIQKILGATLLGAAQESTAIGHVLLDSRKLIFPDTSLFFALAGPRRSGESYIPELYEKGVRLFVVKEGFTIAMNEYQGACFFVVKDVLAALQSLAAHHRKQFDIPVIGITGSNGKTIVKEWLYQLLQEDFNIVRSPKSYNSQTGVALSILQMGSEHSLGIFEAGISQADEMQHLEKMIKPTLGIFTNIGAAHSEGFMNIRQKVNEKLRLFVHSELLVYNADNPDVNTGVNAFSMNVRNSHDLELFAWCRKDGAALQITSVETIANKTTIKARDLRKTATDQELVISIPFTDEASIQNAITCWCVLLTLNIPADSIALRMQLLKPVEMRLELKQGINNCSVINDSYSADLNSLTIALDFLVQQQQHPKRTVILSDILQSGKGSRELYEEVAVILVRKGISRFIGIGVEISRQKEVFKALPELNFFASTSELKSQFHSLHFHNETILLKGARVFEFEQISHLLEQKVHQTVLEINLNAVSHNLREYQQLLHPRVKLMAMVKAFSYGSGGYEIANLLQFHKVDYLAVAYADEGVELRRAGISLPILVLNPEEATFDVLIQYTLEPEMYSFNLIRLFETYLAASGLTNYPVHIKLDTGMHRLGFEESDIEQLSQVLSSSTRLKVQSVFSHLAASDASSLDFFTEQQSEIFLRACSVLQTSLSYPFIRHISNTSSIHRHPHLQLDMVRLGIGLYGVDNNPEMQVKLRNVSTLKTTISQLKKVRSGESVGYNRKGLTYRDSLIATVRIGYADGYPRGLSNGVGSMFINGVSVPVIGNVCMDMTMLDVTNVAVSEGDEVIVFGESLPVQKLAVAAETIPYEILTGISQRVKRVYFEE